MAPALAAPSPADRDLGSAAALGAALADECARAVRTERATLEAAVVALFSGGHLLIEDVPGVGKTVLAKSLAKAAGCRFSRLQCTADLLPADVTGITVWDQRESVFRFQPGPVFAHVVLVDEVNRASPKTQSALLECMEEGQVTVDGDTRVLPEPFMVVATQNPVEYEGTFPLPEAQLDRFALRLAIGYPGAEIEADMLLRLAAHDPLDAVRVVADPASVQAARAAVGGVHVDPSLAAYVVGLCEATRRDARLALGASPRAGLSLIRAAAALALVGGRDYADPDDVKSLAPSALAHRLVVGADARARGVTPEEVVDDALGRVPVPR